MRVAMRQHRLPGLRAHGLNGCAVLLCNDVLRGMGQLLRIKKVHQQAFGFVLNDFLYRRGVAGNHGAACSHALPDGRVLP